MQIFEIKTFPDISKSNTQLSAMECTHVCIYVRISMWNN